MCGNETHSYVGMLAATARRMAHPARSRRVRPMSTAQQGAFRNTTQRSIILRVVESADSHLTAAQIFERVRRDYPSIAYGTVYRTLHLLAQHTLIQELTFADQASRFDKRTERHDHVHCSVCGSIEDVDVPVALLAQHVASERTGYDIDSHHTVFVGICPACQAKLDTVERMAPGDATGGTTR